MCFSGNKSLIGNYIQFDTYCPNLRTKHTVVILYEFVYSFGATFQAELPP